MFSNLTEYQLQVNYNEIKNSVEFKQFTESNVYTKDSIAEISEFVVIFFILLEMDLLSCKIFNFTENKNSFFALALTWFHYFKDEQIKIDWSLRDAFCRANYECRTGFVNAELIAAAYHQIQSESKETVVDNEVVGMF